MAGFVATPLRSIFAEETRVTVRQGTLSGLVEGNLRVFRGIPFARPPIGPLRFRPPVPPEPWIGVREATRNAPAAIQGGPNDSEDCLYLNVWAPQGNGPFPVLVWIHGGGNAGGGTNGQSGASFAREGIVVVTIAYRLGTFGFLELGGEYADSGTNGIRDQEAALRWVRVNIHAFGGDPKQVTISGHSAGAKDVAALMGAPSAQGLFARAVMLSGGGQTIHTRESAAEATAGLFAALALKPGETDRLLKLSAAEIHAGQRRLEATYAHNFAFRPFVGGKYLPKRPVDLVRGHVPLLIGTARDESLTFMSRADAGKPIRSREIANVPFARIPEMEARYWAAFPKDSDLDRRIHLVTAEEYWVPSIRFAEAHSSRGGQTWMYRFDHVPTDPKDNHHGYATHGADVGYVWNPHRGWTLHETVTAFIKGVAPSWKMYDRKERATLIYGQDGGTNLVHDPSGDQRRLWDRLL